MKKILTAVSLLVLSGMQQVSAAANVPAAEFFKGKIVKIVVTAPPGAVNDIYGRLAADHLSKLTGARVVVENQTAAGGLVAQNNFSTVVKPDGLTLLCESTGRIWPAWLLGEKNVRFDINKFEYLPGAKGGPWVLGVAPKGAVNTVDLLRKTKNLKVPSSTPASILSLAAMGVSEALALNSRIIIGMSSDAAYLSLQQGEAHFMVRNYDSIVRSVQQGMIKPLLQIGTQRDALLPDLPALSEVVTLSDANRKLVDVLFREAKIFILPPGTPRDRVEFWKTNVEKMLADAQFQARVKQNFGIWMGVYSTADIRDNITYLTAHRDDMKRYLPLIGKYVK